MTVIDTAIDRFAESLIVIPADEVDIATPTWGSDEVRYRSDYPTRTFARPALCVDVVTATIKDGRLCTLLVQRQSSPERGRYALPGTFVGADESLDEAVARVLLHQAGLTNVYAEQLSTTASPAHEDRTRVLTVTYLALVAPEHFSYQAGEKDPLRSTSTHQVLARLEVSNDASSLIARGALGSELELAFDHAAVLGVAVTRLREKLAHTQVGSALLAQEFLLRDLQQVHEVVLGHSLNKDSFRRSMIARGAVEATGRFEGNVKWRPAEFYRFADASLAHAS
jgi:8-oxo-dGTP diphosphatase